MKYAFIRDNQMHYPVLHLCEVLGVPPGGYYARRRRPVCQRVQGNAHLDVHIQAVFAEHKGRYGSPRIAEELRRDHGKTCGDNRVAARMHALGLHSKGKRKYKATTQSNHTLPVAPNLFGATLRGRGAESEMGQRYHLRVDRRGLVVSGGGA